MPSASRHFVHRSCRYRWRRSPRRTSANCNPPFGDWLRKTCTAKKARIFASTAISFAPPGMDAMRAQSRANVSTRATASRCSTPPRSARSKSSVHRRPHCSTSSSIRECPRLLRVGCVTGSRSPRAARSSTTASCCDSRLSISSSRVRAAMSRRWSRISRNGGRIASTSRVSSSTMPARTGRRSPYPVRSRNARSRHSISACRWTTTSCRTWRRASGRLLDARHASRVSVSPASAVTKSRCRRGLPPTCGASARRGCRPDRR